MTTTKNVFVKFRTTERQRDRLNRAAAGAGTTSSVLLRRFILDLPRSALPDRGQQERADWAHVRQLANQIISASADAYQGTSESAARIRAAASALHTLASQRLGPIS